MNALASLPRRVIVQPPRHKAHAQKPVCEVEGQELAAVAATLARIIQRNKRHHTCGSFVYVGVGLEGGHTMQAFVISEDSPIAPSWLLTRVRSLMGFYEPARGMSAQPSELAEDLRQHLEDIA
jgi:hypothetical protein